MFLKIKLYGGMVCKNVEMACYGLNRFDLDIPMGLRLQELYKKLELGRDNLVSIVNGKAQLGEYILNEDCEVSIFLPMGDRQYDFLGKIK